MNGGSGICVSTKTESCIRLWDADLKVSDDSPKIQTLEETKLQSLIQKMEAILKDKIKAVKVSKTLNRISCVFGF